MAINTCRNLKCAKDFKSRKLKKKFCSNICYLQHRLDNPEDYKNGRFQKRIKIGDLKICTETIKNGSTRSLRFINIGDGNDGIKYVRNDKYVWEQANGPMPIKHIIYHKDERDLNDDIENLECISLSEAIFRRKESKRKVYDFSNKKDIAKIIKGCQQNNKRMQKMLFDTVYNSCIKVAMR